MPTAILRTVIQTQSAAAEAKLASYGKQVNTTASTATKGLSAFGVSAGMVFAGAAVAVGAFVSKSISAYSANQRVMAQTEAVLKSTGGAAGVTAKQIGAMANSLAVMTGIDDEAIQATENLLATFTQVRNEAGKNNDVFDQTTKAVLDMATAMNGGAIPSQEELLKTTIMVGKAMNDPITGMSKLMRVGVTFTASQRAMIQSLTQSGDLMGAQKIVLAELNKEFGGSSTVDTYERSIGKLKTTFGNFMEVVGHGAVIVLTDFARGLEGIGQAGGFLEDKIGDVVRFFNLSNPFGNSKPQADEVAAAIPRVAVAAESMTARVAESLGMSEQDFVKWQTGTESALNGVEGSLGDLATKAHLSAAGVLKAFQEQFRAQLDLQTNWETLLARGLPADFAKQLQDMGIKGATIVNALAHANESKFNAIVAAWQGSQNVAHDTAAAISGIKRAEDMIDPKKTVTVTAVTSTAVGSLMYYRQLLASIPTQKTTYLYTVRSGSTSPYGHSGGAVTPGGIFHGGGTVQRYHSGGLRSGDVPAILQTGEFVLRKQAVNSIGLDVLRMLNNMGGGAAGTSVRRPRPGGQGGPTVNITVSGGSPQEVAEHVSRELIRRMR